MRFALLLTLSGQAADMAGEFIACLGRVPGVHWDAKAMLLPQARSIGPKISSSW